MPVWTIAGKTPRIDATAWIAPDAVIIGDVEIGAHASVWFGSVLRGDMHYIRVGPYTNIQDHCIVHVTKDRFPAVIGAYVTIGHRAIVHACRIGDGCLIGMGAVIMDGAEIGEACLIAAGSVVPPGKKIPPRSLVMGVPGRIVRSLTDAEVAQIRENTMLYVEYAERYRNGLQP